MVWRREAPLEALSALQCEAHFLSAADLMSKLVLYL